MSTPLYETDRLIVRHFNAADLDDFAALCADQRVMRYMGDGITLPRSEVARWIDICQDKYAQRGYGTSAIFEKSSGTFIGYCGVVRAPGNDFDELVYAYHTASWGKGYATEASRAMLGYVFARSALDAIYATIHPDNHNSKKVAEKSGFQFDRQEIDEDGTPVDIYVIKRVAWTD